MKKKKNVTMILKGATRVLRHSKEGVNYYEVGFTRLDAIEIDGKNVLSLISAPIVKLRGYEHANIHKYGPVAEVKDCDSDELALQIEIEGEFNPEWMALFVADFKSTEIYLIEGVWYKTGGNEENWDWYDNLSSPIMID